MKDEMIQDLHKYQAEEEIVFSEPNPESITKPQSANGISRHHDDDPLGDSGTEIGMSRDVALDETLDTSYKGDWSDGTPVSEQAVGEGEVIENAEQGDKIIYASRIVFCLILSVSAAVYASMAYSLYAQEETASFEKSVSAYKLCVLFVCGRRRATLLWFD